MHLLGERYVLFDAMQCRHAVSGGSPPDLQVQVRKENAPQGTFNKGCIHTYRLDCA